MKNQVTVILDARLPNTEAKPPIKIGEQYTVQETCICGCGEEHVDIGIMTDLNFVRCHTCGQKLPKVHEPEVWEDGDKIIHWCHSSRFEQL